MSTNERFMQSQLRAGADRVQVSTTRRSSWSTEAEDTRARAGRRRGFLSGALLSAGTLLGLILALLFLSPAGGIPAGFLVLLGIALLLTLLFALLYLSRRSEENNEQVRTRASGSFAVVDMQKGG